MTESTLKITVEFPVSVISEIEKDDAMHLGISFNGTQYLYREFKYDKLPDAVAYAAFDIAREGSKPVASSPVDWLERQIPDEGEQEMMQQYGISFEGWRYKYQDFRYDRLADAIKYAASSVKQP